MESIEQQDICQKIDIAVNSFNRDIQNCEKNIQIKENRIRELEIELRRSRKEVEKLESEKVDLGFQLREGNWVVGYPNGWPKHIGVRFTSVITSRVSNYVYSHLKVNFGDLNMPVKNDKIEIKVIDSSTHPAYRKGNPKYLEFLDYLAQTARGSKKEARQQGSRLRPLYPGRGEVGFGVFVRVGERIQRGEKIVPYAGEITIKDWIAEREERDEKRGNFQSSNAYCMAVCDREGDTSQFVIDASKRGNEARFINDWRNISRRPNCSFTQKYLDNGAVAAFIYAISNIEPGEELLLDYGDLYWDVKKKEEKKQQKLQLKKQQKKQST